MIQGIRGATTRSEDLKNLMPFRREFLGLPVAIQIPGIVVLGGPGAATRPWGRKAKRTAAMPISEAHGRPRPQARPNAYLASFEVAWRGKPISPVAGTVVEWP